MKILNASSEMLLFGIERQPLNIDSLLEDQKIFILHFYDFIKNDNTYKPSKNISYTKRIYNTHNVAEKNQVLT